MYFATMREDFCILHTVLLCFVTGSSIPHPDFESGWLPIINGLEHVARLNVDHGLGELPVLVDVCVRADDHIFPASGFRPDHPVEQSGPVVYIYDEKFVNVSTSPNEDPLFRIVPSVPPRFYRGDYKTFFGPVYIRVSAWKQSTLPMADFNIFGINLKANTSKASDSYAEINHHLNEVPCLVVVRINMQRNDDVIYADGVGSSMQVFAGMPDRTNAYLVYGYSSTAFRLWVDSSHYGAIFDGRKHTWFGFVISEGEAEIFAWRCSTLTPVYNERVETKHTMGQVPAWRPVVTGYDMEYSFTRVSIKAEQPGGANEGYQFPGAMHLGYPSDVGNAIKPVSFGGLSYAYETKYRFLFWLPELDMKSSIFIADSFGEGTNSENSSSESIYIQSWMFEENSTCKEPVVPRGYADTSIDGKSTGAEARVHCNDGYILKPKDDFYIYDNEENTIKCHKFGFWENVPSCLPEAKELDTLCNPAEDKCRDKHATCRLAPSNDEYRCLCDNGYRKQNTRCLAQGSYLPKPDYDSDWKSIHRSDYLPWHGEFEHGFGTVPMLVDVQVTVSDYIVQAIGFRPDKKLSNPLSAAVVYVYDDKFINISSDPYVEDLLLHFEYSVPNFRWFGYQTTWRDIYSARARAWKAESLPSPDIVDNTHIMRANTSKSSDSFYELRHSLNELPGLVVVRAKMVQRGQTFFANGVGSALNVFYNDPEMTNAYLVYGYSNDSFRAWVDSSKSGAIFDGRKYTSFDFFVSEATIEIYAWKISTITPFFTYKFSLEDLRIPNSVTFPINFRLKDGFNVAVAEITDSLAKNRGFVFPSAAYMANRYMREDDWKGGDCKFGGFTYAYVKRQRFYTWHIRDTDLEMLLYKPKNLTHLDGYSGSLLCIPNTFGNGEYSEAAFNGVGTLYSWIQADCGKPPDLDQGYIDTTVNGTDIGAIASVRCYEGYRLSSDESPRCYVGDPDAKWINYVTCLPVECGTIEVPVNGTMNATGETFGSKVTFECDAGYKLNGDSIVECLSTGKWSRDSPVCKPVDDEKPTTSCGHRNSKNVIGIAIVSVIVIRGLLVSFIMSL